MVSALLEVDMVMLGWGDTCLEVSKLYVLPLDSDNDGTRRIQFSDELSRVGMRQRALRRARSF